MKRLDHGHLHPLLEPPETNMSRPGIEPRAACFTGVHSSKELFEQPMPLLFGTSTTYFLMRSSAGTTCYSVSPFLLSCPLGTG